MSLISKKCIPCQIGTPPLQSSEINKLLPELNKDWQVVKEHHLIKSFSFANFKEALAFVNKVGTIAEQEGHHPGIELSWGKVVISIWTHKIDGLTASDFVLAAKIDNIK